MSKELVPSSLTTKNKAFLANLLKGMKPVEAYRAAGYKGEDDAAYMLKYRLRDELSALIASKSNLDETLLELEHLNEKELMQTQITMNQKLRIIALKLQALKQRHAEQSDKGPKTFTAFIVNRESAKPVDAEIVDTNDAPPTNA